MPPTVLVMTLIFAMNDGEVEHFPLPYQIVCIVLTACFLWAFSVARDPRGWRRLYQAKFSKKEDFSVNKNKKIDESMKKWGIIIAMMFLVVDVSFFLLGVTYRYRNQQRQTTKEEQFRASEVERVNVYEPKGGSRKQAF